MSPEHIHENNISANLLENNVGIGQTRTDGVTPRLANAALDSAVLTSTATIIAGASTNTPINPQVVASSAIFGATWGVLSEIQTMLQETSGNPAPLQDNNMTPSQLQSQTNSRIENLEARVDKLENKSDIPTTTDYPITKGSDPKNN